MVLAYNNFISVVCKLLEIKKGRLGDGLLVVMEWLQGNQLRSLGLPRIASHSNSPAIPPIPSIAKRRAKAGFITRLSASILFS
ncbi:MAG: hypothetical protein WC724_00575 [Candidatus Paceibacterota bacterium]|jgi:hypothetical protein